MNTNNEMNIIRGILNEAFIQTQSTGKSFIPQKLHLFLLQFPVFLQQLPHRLQYQLPPQLVFKLNVQCLTKS